MSLLPKFRIAKKLRRWRADCRSSRAVAVIECILNQNVRDAGSACFPATNEPGVRALLTRSIGILSMPCPEITCLGPIRDRPKGQTIAVAMSSPECARRCARLSGDVADRIAALAANNVNVLAVLGGNAESPSCAVHVEPDVNPPGTLSAPSGLFLRALQVELRRRGIDLPFLPVRDAEPAMLHRDLSGLEAFLDHVGA